MSFEDLKQGYRNIQQLSEQGVGAIAAERFEELQTLLTARRVGLDRQQTLLGHELEGLRPAQRSELRSLAESALKLEHRMEELLLAYLARSRSELESLRNVRGFMEVEALPAPARLLDGLA